jgi:hypothetical protein
MIATATKDDLRMGDLDLDHDHDHDHASMPAARLT